MIIYNQGSFVVKLPYRKYLWDTDHLSPSTPKESYRTRQSKNNSRRCSIFGNKGKIDSPSDSDEFDEEKWSTHTSLQKMGEMIKENTNLDLGLELKLYLI